MPRPPEDICIQVRKYNTWYKIGLFSSGDVSSAERRKAAGYVSVRRQRAEKAMPAVCPCFKYPISCLVFLYLIRPPSPTSVMLSPDRHISGLSLKCWWKLLRGYTGILVCALPVPTHPSRRKFGRWEGFWRGGRGACWTKRSCGGSRRRACRIRRGCVRFSGDTYSSAYRDTSRTALYVPCR